MWVGIIQREGSVQLERKEPEEMWGDRRRGESWGARERGEGGHRHSEGMGRRRCQGCPPWDPEAPLPSQPFLGSVQTLAK